MKMLSNQRNETRLSLVLSCLLMYGAATST